MKYTDEELTAVYASAAIGLCVLDADMRFIRINDYLAGIHGVPASGHIGKTLHEAAPHIAVRAEPMIRAVIDTGDPVRGTWFSGIAASGAGPESQLDGRCVPLRDRHGRVVAVSVTVREAMGGRPTRRAGLKGAVEFGCKVQSRTEEPGETVRGSARHEEILQKIIDNIPVMFIFFDSNGVIEYVSPTSEELSGYSREDLIGKSARVFGEEIHEDYRRTFAWIDAERKSWSGRRKARLKSGKEIEVSVSVSPVFDECSVITNYVVVLKDITREVKLQQQLAQIQKIEAIGTLAGGIAHDLKNIFVPILLNTELALQDAGPENPIRPLLEETFQAVKLGNDLVNQIITFSRRNLQMKKPVVVSSVIREALSFLRATLPSTIEMVSRIVEDDAVVMADSTQIKQVLMNLGSNAAYAMREKGGTLEVTLTSVTLDEVSVTKIAPDLDPGAYVQITVRDTGMGMDESSRQRIFDPFFTTRDKSESTGMGLAVVHGIIKDHKGLISVQSKPGSGAVFTILLPALRKNPGGENSTGEE